jgi:hypothetical protein
VRTAWRTREGNPEGGEFRLSNLFAKLQNLEIGFAIPTAINVISTRIPN